MYQTVGSFLRRLSRSVRRSRLHPAASVAVKLHTANLQNAQFSKSQLPDYQALECWFKRRLETVYHRYSDIPDNTVVLGCDHVYIEDGGVIYRATRGLEELEPEEVLCADCVGEGNGSIQRVRISPNERVMAATVKTPHRDEAKCIVVRLDGHSVARQPVVILDQVFSFEWAADNLLLYSKQEGLKCHSVHRLDFNDSNIHSTLVYEEHDPEFFVEVGRSRDGRLLTLNCTSKSCSEVWVSDTATPHLPPALVQRRQPGLLYHVEHSADHVYILANTGPGQEYQLLRAPLSTTCLENWVPLFTPSPGSIIKDMELLQEHCVFTIRHPSGHLGLCTVSLKDPSSESFLKLPPWACSVEMQRNYILDRQTFQFLLSSPVCPPFPCVFSPATKQLVTDARPCIDYNTTRLEASSKDGTLVPLTLLHKPALAELKEMPLLVHVYGAYGLEINMSFSSEKRLLLDHGWALAYCHVRGGGERGLGWHRAGCLEAKQRGVEDLVACIQRLFHVGVSQPNLTALTARSAGAVLVGALCNQQPHLVRAVTLQAPFLDVLGTMQDPSHPLTIQEIGEWGDPLTNTHHRENIASYCPSHNITPQKYPSMLITAYSEDSRVPIAGVQTYVERLKAAIQNQSRQSLSESGAVTRIVLDLQPGGDHFGPEDFDLSLAESARQLAFLQMELGLDNPPSQQRCK
ncbi:prolyl endopeptidase-like [Denticeps clupeoides]|uniref:Prolyl endopeptidase n=1 Tax=Denticeps clupeoides TaxID=299321 RepID=A0AAY4D2T7_9TELE|nr:prolyl endopeptidase-like [Denticeps clupeoides]